MKAQSAKSLVKLERARLRRLAHSLRRRRRIPGVAVTGSIPLTDIPRVYAIPRRRNRIAIHLPENLSLRENFADTMAAINSLRDATMRRNMPVMLYFDGVRYIEPAATLVLAAEIARCSKLRPYQGNLLVNGNYPPDMDLVLQLHEMGFYKAIGVPEQDLPADEATMDRPRFLKFFSFSTVESELAAGLTDLVSVGAFELGDRMKRRMTGAVKEAMGNAVEHAYRSPGIYPTIDGTWWCAAYVDPPKREMMIILFDQGIGIPHTLDADLFDLIRSIVTTRTWQLSDGYMIAAATELYRTSTGQPGRGRGFRDMKKFIDSCDDGELRVLSNRGGYRYMKTGEEVTDEPSSVGGTLVEWRVRHGQPVDFEDA